MIQQQFAEKAAAIVLEDPSAIGLAAAGSWLSHELDEFSDLDLILVTKHKAGGDKKRMMEWAAKFGQLLSAFTGEHVGEPRLLICLYDNPLLHVDIKFLTLEEFAFRVEEPVILADMYGQLEQSLQLTEAKFPMPEYQWIEDRFWVWIHYGLTKTGRGEYFEAMDFLSAIRSMVLGPLLLIRQGQLPRGVRKVEFRLPDTVLEQLKGTVADYDPQSILKAMHQCVHLYRELRDQLYDAGIQRQTASEKRVLAYAEEIRMIAQRVNS
ncbi:nucleotidyltransferase domain-containing protein [Pseudoflavitalea sp. G-6-1-2]|uniref:nucleotidyltransferase domain-containing protein n=1 Tax=Pseudoflavitalea sp. G-6-1-2 TaxID=2728841 RepID=UPI00146E1CB3|nr:nucleotidyltransferase domain-containing protein [Pseudoflavitalea sp. G-6-1-2]NML23492.1 nucleotidyltransferase domain-containing protein [Pseudoflavitalea sp. G-6-1-2]